MTSPGPILCEWTGAEFRPINHRWMQQAASQWSLGEKKFIEAREERSAASHSHYFAELTALWENLPDGLAERFPSLDHLRRYALIRAGFRDERSFVCKSAAEARRFAAFLRPMDEFAVVGVHEAAIVVWTAKSQSLRAMGRQEFERSKASVLDFVAGLIGADRRVA